MKWFDWSLEFNGYPLGYAKQLFEELASMDAENIRRHQRDRCSFMVEHHWRHTPFYRNWLLGKGVSNPLVIDWKDLPVMQKADLQVPLEQRLSEDFSPDKVFRNSTSGSSGVPLVFARNRFCHAMNWAGNMHRYAEHGIDLNRSRQARFYGIPLTGRKRQVEKLKDALGRRVRFPVFDMGAARLDQYLSVLGSSHFDYLYGYASSLVLLAKHCLERGKVLRDICPGLRLCITTSEMCSDDDRKVMQAGFGVRVVNEYGAAELDILAMEDQQGRWIMNEETLFVEVLDENNRPVPDGISGRVVVTSLYNLAHPMIRYELGDIATLYPAVTENGRRLLASLQGRINDIAELPDGRRVPGLTFYYVAKEILDKTDGIREFVVRQEAPDRFRIDYVSDSDLGDGVQELVRQAADRYVGGGMVFTLRRCGQIQRTAAGKLRHFEVLPEARAPLSGQAS